MDGGNSINSNGIPAGVAMQLTNASGKRRISQESSAPRSQAAASGGSSDAATTAITAGSDSKANSFSFNQLLHKLKALRGSNGSSVGQSGGEHESQPPPAAESGSQSASGTQGAENQPPPPPPGEPGTIAGSVIGAA